MPYYCPVTGGGGEGGAAGGIKSFKRVICSPTGVSSGSLSWSPMNGGLVTADVDDVAVGDVIGVTCMLGLGTNSSRGLGIYDVASWVDGEMVNSWAFDAPVDDAVFNTGWFARYDAGYQVIFGDFKRAVTAEDLVDGTLTIKVIYITDNPGLPSPDLANSAPYYVTPIEITNYGPAT